MIKKGMDWSSGKTWSGVIKHGVINKIQLTLLRSLNTVLQAVSSNSREGACFKLDKQTWRQKSNGTQNWTIS